MNDRGQEEARDVPPSALSKQISVRFGELGFGTTRGYIDLPQAAL